MLVKDGTVYAGAYCGGVFCTTDSGKSWKPEPSFHTNHEDWLLAMDISRTGDLSAILFTISASAPGRQAITMRVVSLPAGASA